MNLLALIYILGAIATMMYLVIAFVTMNYRDGTQATMKDFWISILGVALWPFFWILLIVSQFK